MLAPSRVVALTLDGPSERTSHVLGIIATAGVPATFYLNGRDLAARSNWFGPDVCELLPEPTLAQKWDLTVNEPARNVHAHPTPSEALEEAVHGMAGHMINF